MRKKRKIKKKKIKISNPKIIHLKPILLLSFSPQAKSFLLEPSPKKKLKKPGFI
jgi:hypothetical protein